MNGSSLSINQYQASICFLEKPTKDAAGDCVVEHAAGCLLTVNISAHHFYRKQSSSSRAKVGAAKKVTSSGRCAGRSVIRPLLRLSNGCGRFALSSMAYSEVGITLQDKEIFLSTFFISSLS